MNILGLPGRIGLASRKRLALALSAFLHQENFTARAALPGEQAKMWEDESLPEALTLFAGALSFLTFRAGGSGHDVLEGVRNRSSLSEWQEFDE
jgi:hypothetical protein